MTVQLAAALLVMYGLITAENPTAEAALWSKRVQEPAFALISPRVSSKGRGEATERQSWCQTCLFASNPISICRQTGRAATACKRGDVCQQAPGH